MLVNTQPVPEKDRKTKNPRQEGPTLQQLIDSDQMLAGQAELLRGMIDGKNGAWLIENNSDLQEGVKAIDETLRRRQGLLMS